MDLQRIRQLQERVADGDVELFWKATAQQLMDMGTKCLPIKQHKYLRDVSNGYAAARSMWPDAIDWPSCMCSKDEFEQGVRSTVTLFMQMMREL